MDNDILNLEQAMELFGVSERTMLKLLREENVPARKIGREWRFSRAALLRWLGEGDSAKYQNHTEQFQTHVGPKAVLCELGPRAAASKCLPCCPELRKKRSCPGKAV